MCLRVLLKCFGDEPAVEEHVGLLLTLLQAARKLQQRLGILRARVCGATYRQGLFELGSSIVNFAETTECTREEYSHDEVAGGFRGAAHSPGESLDSGYELLAHAARGLKVLAEEMCPGQEVQDMNSARRGSVGIAETHFCARPVLLLQQLGCLANIVAHLLRLCQLALQVLEAERNRRAIERHALTEEPQRRGAVPSSHGGLTQILGNQYPSIFTISSHCPEDL